MSTHQELTPLGHAFAGALGAVFANTVVYPLDTVKTVIQATKEDRKAQAKGKGGRRTDRSGVIALLYQIFKDEGFMGLYNGYAATMLNTFSNQYAYFFFYTLVRTSYIRRLANRRKAHHGSGSTAPALSTAAELILGAVAGGLSQIFTIPVSVIALRQQIYRSKGVPSSALAARRNGAKKELPLNEATSANKSYAQAVKQPSPDALASEEHSRSRHERHFDSNSFTDVARRIIKEEGVAGLWLGLKPSLVLTVNPAITYGAFERIKGLLLLSQFAKGISSGGKLSPGTAFLLGALSKTLATIVTYPYIMAKVRIQAGAKNESDKYADGEPYDSEGEDDLPPPITMQTKSERRLSKPTAPKPQRQKDSGALGLLKEVYMEDGPLGWYRGMQAQILKAVLSQALLFMMKDRFELLALAVIRYILKARRSVGL